MTLSQIEYALALQHYSNFNRASKHLGISQPALSIQIKKLEEEMDLLIFDRSKKKVELTEKGRLFLDRAQLLINEARQLKKLAVRLNENLKGELRIGVIPTLAPYLLPLFINQLNEKYSHLKIHIKESLTEEIIQDIKSGELDGGIIATPISSKISYNAIPLFYEGFKLFVSSTHELYDHQRVDVKEIPFQDVWLLKEGNCFRDQVNNICEFARDRGGQDLFYFESNSIESLCRIVEFKGGITFLPELTTMHLHNDKEDMIKDLNGPRKVREISIIFLPNHIRQNDLKHFAEIIRLNLPKNLLNKGKAKTVPTNVIV